MNYWGYQPVSFFAPHHAYSSRHGAARRASTSSATWSRRCTAPASKSSSTSSSTTPRKAAHDGPTLCYRGLANDVYYILEKDRSRYADYTGCGNTLNANQPIVRRLILDSLRYWVTEMHVDGFRFDLASILSRDETGHPLPNPPVLWDIESDPLLAGTKLIAEAWDAAGLYQVGSFVGDAWQEWNGRFRDDVRRFLEGRRRHRCRASRRGCSAVPTSTAHKEREAEQSINFVTCHDGFTLNDLVSYNDKHNEANGEDNRDGADDNLSWNCGVEGPTDDPAIEALRNRQVKNFLALDAARGRHADAAHGRRSAAHAARQQQRLLPGQRDQLVRLGPGGAARRHPPVREAPQRLPPAPRRRRGGIEAEPQPAPAAGRRFNGSGVRCSTARLERALALAGDHAGEPARTLSLLHGIFNAYWEPLAFELPPAPTGTSWRRCIDTALALARRHPPHGARRPR